MKKGTIVIDAGGAELPPDVLAPLQQIADELGYDVREGRVLACTTCGFFECVCEARKVHKPDCRYLTALACPVSFECKHGFDVCPECDACTCGVA